MAKNVSIMPQKNLLCGYVNMLSNNGPDAQRFIKAIHHRLETIGLVCSMIRITKQHLNAEKLCAELRLFIQQAKSCETANLSRFINDATRLKAFLEEVNNEAAESF